MLGAYSQREVVIAQIQWISLITLAPRKRHKPKANGDQLSQEVDAFLSINLLEWLIGISFSRAINPPPITSLPS
jgi:hypothetical protein